MKSKERSTGLPLPQKRHLQQHEDDGVGRAKGAVREMPGGGADHGPTTIKQARGVSSDPSSPSHPHPSRPLPLALALPLSWPLPRACLCLCPCPLSVAPSPVAA